MGKGYKLTAATGAGPKTCAFYFSDKGCRNGATCKFSHEKPTAGSTPPPGASVSSSSVCSSESASEGEIVEERAGAYASLPRKMKDARPDGVSSHSNPFLSAVGASPTTTTPPARPPPEDHKVAAKEEEPPQQRQQQQPEKKKRKKRKKKDAGLAPGENIFDLVKAEAVPPPNGTNNVTGAAASAAAAAPPRPAKKAKQALAKVASPPQKHPHPQKQHPTSTPHSAAPPSFRDLHLPVVSLSTPVTAPAASPTPDARLSPPSPPLPAATPAHREWEGAVVATRAHPRYPGAFNYDRAQQYEAAAGISDPADWITTSSRPYGSWCKDNPAAIAIDCEMCETRCPLTGKLDTKALCRVSVVNADDPAEVLLDTLVKPQWPVSNYRTWVNGITEADLKDVAFTLKHAQIFMQALCSDQTVIVGHAVHNDLLALRMVHHCNVDTALLFTHVDEIEGSPSLKNLAHGVLQLEMPSVHDSVNDARVALECARHYVARRGKVDPIEKVFSRSREGRISTDALDTAMLLVHRLPRSTLPAHIEEMFLAYTSIKPKHVPEIAFSGSHGKCHVEFLTKEHSELAYMTLRGDEREDKGGKKQKRLGLKHGGYVCVRKMRKGK